MFDLDTIDAAIDLKRKGYKPLLLNMADDDHPGGMVERGSAAQEENLFRRSNYYKTLTLDMYPLKETDIIYSPQVYYFKSNEASNYELYGKNGHNGIKIDTIAVPAIRYPAMVQENTTQDTILKFKNENEKTLMREKIEMIFKCGCIYNHDALILSAHGCGAWGGPTHEIAILFKEMAQKYDKCFRHIVFAILDNKLLEGWASTGNYSVFKTTLTY